MPRRGRGAGRPGESYSNRTDLQMGPRVSDVGPQEVHGQRSAMEDQVRQGQQAVQQVRANAPRPQLPPLTALDAPTQREWEPVTAGLPSGAGPGPEALRLGARDEEVDDLAAAIRYLPILELVASQPDSSVSARNFVRRIRGAASRLDGWSPNPLQER